MIPIPFVVLLLAVTAVASFVAGWHWCAAYRLRKSLRQLEAVPQAPAADTGSRRRAA